MPPRLTPTTLLTILQPWSEVEEPIYRRLAHLAEAKEGGEMLWVGCGSGRAVLWWSERFQSVSEGLDPDPNAIEAAERAARDAGLARMATFQVTDVGNFPHEDQVFDTVVVHMLHLRDADGGETVREAGRVARPMGTVLGLVPVWLKTPSEEDSGVLTWLGFDPHLPVEWKGFFRDAGLVELSVEEVGADGSWLSHSLFPLLVRGWRAAGWQGVRVVLGREVRALRRLVRRRVVGLSIVKGTRWPHG